MLFRNPLYFVIFHPCVSEISCMSWCRVQMQPHLLRVLSKHPPYVFFRSLASKYGWRIIEHQLLCRGEQCKVLILRSNKFPSPALLVLVNFWQSISFTHRKPQLLCADSSKKHWLVSPSDRINGLCSQWNLKKNLKKRQAYSVGELVCVAKPEWCKFRFFDGEKARLSDWAKLLIISNSCDF